jgi:hypothetical protein
MAPKARLNAEDTKLVLWLILAAKTDVDEKQLQ